MRIDGLNLDLRERNAWEAFDLGVALARTTGWKLFLPYSIMFVGLALVLHLAGWIAGLPVWLVLIALWWLKPALDRVALAVLAQAVFGVAPGWRDTLRSLKNIPRTGWLMSFTLGRFDFTRSFHLPVRQLEGQKGKPGRERIRVLDKKLRGPAVWLTIAMFLFIVVLIYGASGLIQLLAPEGVRAGLDFSALFNRGEESLVNQYLFNAAFVLAECVLEPFYIAAGFALYLSRRTALEGWDLEVAFKRMAARIDEQSRPPLPPPSLPGALALLLAGALALAAAMPGAAWAQQKDGDDDDDDDEVPTMVAPAPVGAVSASPAVTAGAARPPSKEKIAVQEALKSPEFAEFADEKTWQYRGPKAKQDGDLPKFGDGFFRFLRFVGELLRGGIWVLAILVLGWLFTLLVRHFGWFKGAFKLDRAKPDVLFGLDLRPESLPDDVPAAARALLAAGDMRAALALLYRGSLSVLVHERDVEIQAGDTEGDCVRRVAKLGPAALAAYFQNLVDAWALIAYAGRRPALTDVQRLVDGWAQHFATRAAPAAPAGTPPRAVPA